MSESTQTKLLSSVPAISSLAEGDKITVVTASGQTALVSLSTLLGAVKVGGRNYIPNSKRFDLSNSTWGVARLSKLVEPLAVGETYIISFDSKSDNLTGRFYLSETAATGFANQSVYANTPFTANGAWQYIWAWVVDNVNGGIEASMDKVKLERGNIPTDWSPAPEDLNWGGVISSFSEASNASVRISKKGGQLHEHIDNTDKGSHQQGAEGNTLRCVGGKRSSRRRGRDNNSGSLLYQSDNRKHATGTGFLWHPYSRKNRRPNGSTRMAMADWPSNSAAHEVQHRYAALESDTHNAYLVTSGKEVAA